MTKCLLILVRPGDELRLAAPLLFPKAALDLEVLHVCAPLTGAASELGDRFLSESMWEQVIALMRTKALGRFDRVIVPSIHGTPPASILCAAVATLGLPNIWMLSDSLHDEVIEVDQSRLPALIEVLNEELARTGLSDPASVRPFVTVVGLRKVESCDILNYAAYLGLPNCPRYEWLYTAVDAGSDPWTLASSAYEGRRHDVELDLLGEIGWSTLVEVGACTGVFTQKVADAFPDRWVTAVENDALFLPQLQGLASPTISVFEGSIFDFHERAEIFTLASCIYEMDEFPIHVLNLAEKAILTSHRADFERDIVERAFTAYGWRQLSSREVLPAVEIYCGEAIVRDGSLANLWIPPPGIRAIRRRIRTRAPSSVRGTTALRGIERRVSRAPHVSCTASGFQ